jgi:hypothetical protein
LEVELLPFLKHKQQSVAGLIIKGRTPDQKQDKPHELEECAKAIIHAIEMKDHVMLAEAMHKAFKEMEKMPHEEASHKDQSPSPHTYDAQNQKAAE